MKLQCAIIPKVKNKNDELVDSRLFKGLLSLTTRESARDIYLNNDKRYHLKQQVNLFFKSKIIEEKSYLKDNNSR